MAAQRHQILGEQPRAGRLEVGRRHAGAELHLQRHAQRLRRLEEVADAGHAQHVGDLVRIADRRGGAARQHLPVELFGRHEAALDMHMGVDEARYGDQAAAVDLAHAAIVVVGADDPVAADRDVADVERAGRDVQDARTLDHQVRLRAADALADPPPELVPVQHAQLLSRRHSSAARGRHQSPRAPACAGNPPASMVPRARGEPLG